MKKYMFFKNKKYSPIFNMFGKTLCSFLFNNGVSLHGSLSFRQMSRIKQRFTMPPFWQAKKTRVLYPENLTPENKEFIEENVAKKYNSPLKADIWEKEEWAPRSYRCGLITKKIGVYPMWTKDGKRILTTLLHASDNHVIKYIPPEELAANDIKFKRRAKKQQLGALIVGADSANPTQFTKEYFNIFESAGVMPKRRLAKFYITPNAKLQPGTPLLAAHFKPGEYVDCQGLTVDRGFQGVMVRWGFKGGRATHGNTKSHRRGGNIGGAGGMGRVWPGTKMPGHMGRLSRTLRGVMVWRVNTKHNVLWVSGPAVPGETGNYVILYDSILRTRFKTEENKPYFPTYFEEEDLPTNLLHPNLQSFSAPSITFAETKK